MRQYRVRPALLLTRCQTPCWRAGAFLLLMKRSGEQKELPHLLVREEP
jgi:hypothetical protein